LSKLAYIINVKCLEASCQGCDSMNDTKDISEFVYYY